MPDLLKLTVRQEAFAQEFAKTRSVSRAYRAAYDCPADISHRELDKRGRSVLNAPAVRERVEDLINEAAGATVFTVREALARWVAIATADPNELVSLKVGACRYCHGDAHAYHWRQAEYLDALADAERLQQAGSKAVKLPDVGGGFDYDGTRDPHPECPSCHGEGLARIVAKDTENLTPGARLLYGGVKNTNTGPQIIMADRMKALENACRIIGAFRDDVTITHDLRKMSDAIAKEITDPAEAARAYMELMAGTNSTPH